MAAGVGIGMLLGPLFGAVLYTFGGYVLPFWFVAFLCIALYPMLRQVIEMIAQKEQEIQAGKNKSADKVAIDESETADPESQES
jgi:MFS family permease